MGQIRWVSVIAMLTLSGLIHAESLMSLWAKAQESNPTLKQTEYAVEQAKAQQDQVMSKLLPSVALTGQYSYNQRGYSNNATSVILGGNYYPGYQTSLRLNQILFDLPAYLNVKGAELAAQQNEQQALAARMQVGLDLVDAYLLVLETEDVLDQLKAENEFMEGQLRGMRLQYEMHMAKVTDLLEVEAYNKKLKNQEITARNKRALALEALRKVSGLAPTHLDVLLIKEFPPVEKSEDYWVEEALAHNPKLMALKFAVDGAQKKIESSKAEHLPTVSAYGSETLANIGYNNLQVTNGGGSYYNVTSAGVMVNVPLYAGGGLEAGVGVSVATYQQAREKHEEERRTVEHKTRSAFLTATASQSGIEAAREEIDFREQTLIAEKRSYELGKSTIVDMLEAHRKLLQAEIDGNKIKYDYIRSVIELRMNAGSLADLDLEALAPWFGPKPENSGRMADRSVRRLTLPPRPP